MTNFNDSLLHLDWGFIDEGNDPSIIPELTRESLEIYGYKLLQYSDPRGLPQLREQIANFANNNLVTSEVNPSEICVTNGATGAIDLVSRITLKGKYDCIVLEPSFDTAIQSLKINSKNVHGVPIDPFDTKEPLKGEFWKRFKELACRQEVKILYINPTLHNPTGLTLSANDRIRIYDICSSNGVMILEDDPYRSYSEQQKDVIPTFLDIDQNSGNVIYVNSFSKVFFPGIRVGFIIANQELIDAVADVQKYTTSSANLLMQGTCLIGLESKKIDEIMSQHIRIVRNKLILALDAINSSAIQDYADLTSPDNGFFIWGRLKDDQLDSLKLLDICRKLGVSFVPGNIYFIDKEKSNPHFRLACSQIEATKIDTAIKLFKAGIIKYNDDVC